MQPYITRRCLDNVAMGLVGAVEPWSLQGSGGAVEPAGKRWVVPLHWSNVMSQQPAAMGGKDINNQVALFSSYSVKPLK